MPNVLGKRGTLPDDKESLTTGLVNVVSDDGPGTCMVTVQKSNGELTWTVDERECAEGLKLEKLRKYFDHTDLKAITQGNPIYSGVGRTIWRYSVLDGISVI